MAGRASHHGMAALQWEASFAVIKMLGAPAFKAMTARAIRLAIDLKLFAVHILVTAGAVARQTRKLAVAENLVSDVAGFALGALVYPLQHKGGGAVVKEIGAPPGVGGVARLAALVGVILR